MSYRIHDYSITCIEPNSIHTFEREEKKMRALNGFQVAPSRLHIVQNLANSSKVELSQRLLPRPLNHHFTLECVQEGRESSKAFSIKWGFGRMEEVGHTDESASS